MLFNSQERKTSFGLLLMRLGLAAVLAVHAAPKLFSGIAQWRSVGNTLEALQLGVPLHVLGFAVLIAETFGALSLLSGFLFRIACGLLMLLYGFFCFNYFRIGYQSLTLYTLALTVVYLGLMNTGPGRYAVAVKLEKK
jgi:putative oxidoreductase